MNINLAITQISGEKLVEMEKSVVNIQIATNIAVLKASYNESASVLELGFVFTVNYNPAIASITIKGAARVTGEKKELEDMKKAFDERKALPPVIMQNISNVGFVESVVLSRSLNIPPPLPLPTIQQQQQQGKEIKPSLGYIA